MEGTRTNLFPGESCSCHVQLTLAEVLLNQTKRNTRMQICKPSGLWFLPALTQAISYFKYSAHVVLVVSTAQSKIGNLLWSVKTVNCIIFVVMRMFFPPILLFRVSYNGLYFFVWDINFATATLCRIPMVQCVMKCWVSDQPIM